MSSHHKHSRTSSTHPDEHSSDVQQDSEKRFCGGTTMPPEKTMRFDKPLKNRFSVACATIVGHVDLQDGTFFFRDCVFENYTIRGSNVTVRFEGCVFQDVGDIQQYTIIIEGMSSMTSINCAVKRINGFLRLTTPYGCRHTLTNLNITGERRSIVPWCVVECDADIDIDGIRVTYDRDNRYRDRNAPVYDDDSSLNTALNIFSLFDLTAVRNFSSFTVTNAMVNVPANSTSADLFVRGTTDSHIYITRSTIIGMRSVVLIPGDILRGMENIPGSNPVSVAVIPPGGGNPVIIGVNPTGLSSNGIQSATIIPGSAISSTVVNRMWPWPQRTFITRTDMSFLTSPGIALFLIETIGDATIGLQDCNIMTNGLNIPIIMRDATTITLNVIATNLRGLTSSSPWVRLERITQIAHVEYSSSTSYTGLVAIETVNVGILMIMPAGAIA